MNHLITTFEPISGPHAMKFFWSARSENYEPGDDPRQASALGIIGFGASRTEAMDDFFEQLYAWHPRFTDSVSELVERVAGDRLSIQAACGEVQHG